MCENGLCQTQLCIVFNLILFYSNQTNHFIKKKKILLLVTTGSITRHDIDAPPVSERMVSIYKYEDLFMPSTAYQTFNSPFCLLLIVALTFYLLMGTP